MKILLAGFKQETNTFSPVSCDFDAFNQSMCMDDSAELAEYCQGNNEMAGMAKCIAEHNDQAVPALMMRAQSSGRVTKESADYFLKKVKAAIDIEKPDAVFLVMHGGMAIDHDIDDGTGYIYSAIREYVGNDMVIVSSHDMHSNITESNVNTVNAIAGLHTYPHTDFFSTGYRAAFMGYCLLNHEPFAFSCVRIPMIVPAEGYSTQYGVFKEFTDACYARVDGKEILDISIFQMQPWLNVKNAATAVTVAARSSDTADQVAVEIAHELFGLRKDMSVKLFTMDEVIDKAIENTTGKPILLVDSADSPAAGSCADSSAVLERLLIRNTDLMCGIYINDIPAVEQAFQVGIGHEAEFTLGGTLDKNFQKSIRVRARVHSLHEGIYQNEGPAHADVPVNAGHVAVLRIGKIDVVVMSHMNYSYDTQAYRAFGVDPAIYDLIVIKSANQYKMGFNKISTLSFPTDTPGASTANLVSLPFDRIPRPFYPFDDVNDFDCTPLHMKCYKL